MSIFIAIWIMMTATDGNAMLFQGSASDCIDYKKTRDFLDGTPWMRRRISGTTITSNRSNRWSEEHPCWRFVKNDASLIEYMETWCANWAT